MFSFSPLPDWDSLAGGSAAHAKVPSRVDNARRVARVDIKAEFSLSRFLLGWGDGLRSGYKLRAHETHVKFRQYYGR
jgi:hypothetical protein